MKLRSAAFVLVVWTLLLACGSPRPVSVPSVTANAGFPSTSTAAAGGPKYFDPFDYCSAVGNSPVDISRDPRYLGDRLPAVLGGPLVDNVQSLHPWRCSNGFVEKCMSSPTDGFSACVASDTWKVMAVPSGPAYRDPFSYCRARGTVDQPLNDPTYRGAPVPGVIGAAYGDNRDVNLRGLFGWRCFDEKVLGCIVGRGSFFCGKPRADDLNPPQSLVDYCVSSTQPTLTPEVTPTFTIYSWQCRDGKPAITAQQALDSQGFPRDAWKAILGP